MLNTTLPEHQIQLQQQQLYKLKLQPTLEPNNNIQMQPYIQSNNHQSQLNHDQQDQKQFDDSHSLNNKPKHIHNLPNKQIIHNYTQSTNQVQFYQIPKTQKKRNKYGNMIIFCQAKQFILSLGPNYLFFFFAYLSFTIATIYLVGLVNSSLQNINFKIFNFIFCWLQNLSYLLIALSNPGVVLPQLNVVLTQQQIKNKRFCNKCGAIQQRKTYHCRQCDVCISDYDHHCPWTSKCIGGGNLNRFYLFVGLTPFYIFYYMVVFMICMASVVIVHDKNLRTQTPTL